MKFNNVKFRADLITARKIQRNLTMKECAGQIGVSTATISRIERGATVDIDSFCKVVFWMDTWPENYFIVVGRRQDGFNPKRK